MRFAFLFFALVAAGPQLVRAELPEFFPRGGWPNLRSKVTSGAPATVRVAFLGGSITAASHGWRSLTLDWLRTRYPSVHFEEIFAAIPGTGSDYGAMRLNRDVLVHVPDLIFVEFAVNDEIGSPRVEQQMEGIVRQTWNANPKTDIGFVYTVSGSMIPDLQAGRYQSTALSMEKVAEHYAIPTFNWGVAVAAEIAAGRMVMWAPASVSADAQGNDPQGRMIFTRDKTHPTPEGHQFYARRLTGALPKLIAAGEPGAHPLPAPLSLLNWEHVQMISLADVKHTVEWQPVPPGDVHLTTQSGGKLMPTTWVALNAGAAADFDFQGRIVGLLGIKGPENGEFECTVDDLPPERGTLFDRFAVPGHFVLARWFFHHPLAEGRHHVQIKLLDTSLDKAGIMLRAGFPIADPAPYAVNGLYLSAILVVGALSPP